MRKGNVSGPQSSPVDLKFKINLTTHVVAVGLCWGNHREALPRRASRGPQAQINKRTHRCDARWARLEALFSWASGGPQPQNDWKASVSAGPQEASTAGLLASKRFSEASGGPPSQNEWKTNASAGPPEGLSCRTIGKQTVFAHAEAWSRWASRGPQPQKYWKTNSLRGC